MFSRSKSEEKIISEAAWTLRGAGYEVARQMALPSPSPIGPDARIDLVGRKGRETIIIEIMTRETTGTKVYAFTGAVEALVQNSPDLNVETFVLVAPFALSHVRELLGRRIPVTVIEPKTLAKTLKAAIEGRP